MKNNPHHHLPHSATIFFLLTVAVALCSWFGSIYEAEKVQSLLSPEGIRWELRHAISNLTQTPALGIVMILFIGLGIALHSGLPDTLRRIIKKEQSLSLKEKRALILSNIILSAYLLVILCTTFYPWTILRSVTGSLSNSPFQQGIYYLISFGVGFTGVIFGYASGRFRTDKDIVRGMTYLFAHHADYFVTLFFIVQFFSSLMYSNLAGWCGIRSELINYAFQFCCYLPLIRLLIKKR